MARGAGGARGVDSGGADALAAAPMSMFQGQRGQQQ